MARDRRTPIERLIDAAMLCTKCGAPRGGCDCWTPCACGWLYENGGSCGNPAHRATKGGA